MRSKDFSKLRLNALDSRKSPSVSSAYAPVRKEELPMATIALNIVQRLGGPTLTTICATVLGMRLAAAHSQGDASYAFTIGFALLCGFHALLIPAAMRLPRSLGIEEVRTIQDAELVTE
jgi:hypothetical protein